MRPILDPAPPWEPERSEYVILWHGCTLADKNSIERKGIDLRRCKVDTDFGRGFYTTTLERQARYWAWQRVGGQEAQGRSARNQPVVLRFRVRRYGVPESRKVLKQGLDHLLSLHFVLGGYHNEDFWSLVQHCRQSPARPVRDHLHARGGWYDLVTGPVAAFWPQRNMMNDADQVSFHTERAVALLNAIIFSGDPQCYRWDRVTNS